MNKSLSSPIDVSGLDPMLANTTLAGNLVSDNVAYFDETSGRGFSVFDIIRMKKDETQNSTVERLSGKMRELRNKILGVEPLPEPFKVKKQIYSKNELLTYMIDDDVKSNSFKIRVPNLVEEEVTVTTYDPKTDAVGEMDKRIKAPIYNHNEWQGGTYFPVFIPSYSSTPYDKLALTAALELVVSKIPGFDYATSDALMHHIYSEMRQIAQTKYYGSWGPQGQLVRWQQVMKVYEWVVLDKPFYSLAKSASRLKIDLSEKEREIKEKGKREDPVEARRQIQLLNQAMSKIDLIKIFDAYQVVADKMFPIGKPPPKMNEKGELVHFKLKVMSLIDLNIEWHRFWNGNPPFLLMKFNPESNAGIVFKGALHSESGTAEISLAADLLNDLAVLGDYEQTFNKWMFIFLCQMKNKPEVYVQPTYEPTKVRNIFASHVFAGIPAMVSFSLTYKFSPHFLEDTSSRHLLGWSPFHGGVDSLFKFMLLKAPTPKNLTDPVKIHVLVYADNLYVYYKTLNEHQEVYLNFISLDGAKMEASQNREECFLECLRIASKIGGPLHLLTSSEEAINLKGKKRTLGGSSKNKDQEKEVKNKSVVKQHKEFQTKMWTKIDASYINYLFYLLPQLVTGSVALFGEEQLAIPGMASGTIGTGYFNTIKMSLLAFSADEQSVPIGDLPITNDLGKFFNGLCDQHRIRLTVENITKVNLGKENKATKQYDNIFNSYSNKVIKLDLLGYDCFVFNVEGNTTILPALNRERLLNSMLFHKFAHYRRISDGEPMFNIMVIILCKVLYTIGGFAYPDTALILRYIINKYLEDLGVNKKIISDDEFKQQMRNILESLLQEDQFDSIFAEMLESRLPTILDVLKISGPPNGYSGPFGNVPNSILRSFLYKGGWKMMNPPLNMDTFMDLTKMAVDDFSQLVGPIYEANSIPPNVSHFGTRSYEPSFAETFALISMVELSPEQIAEQVKQPMEQTVSNDENFLKQFSRRPRKIGEIRAPEYKESEFKRLKPTITENELDITMKVYSKFLGLLSKSNPLATILCPEYYDRMSYFDKEGHVQGILKMTNTIFSKIVYATLHGEDQSIRLTPSLVQPTLNEALKEKIFPTENFYKLPFEMIGHKIVIKGELNFSPKKQLESVFSKAKLFLVPNAEVRIADTDLEAAIEREAREDEQKHPE